MNSSQRTNSGPPLVSVCVLAYNHERYIAECLRSVLAQDTTFPFEIIVGDDFSTDRTAEVIRDFVSKHPGAIRHMSQASNIGPTANMLAVHGAATGQFVAHLDGDDRMLPGKLAKQAKILLSDPSFSFVVHDVEVIDESSKLVSSTFGGAAIPSIFDVAYLVERGCFFVNSSKMYRRSAAKAPNQPRFLVDFFCHIEHALTGPAAYIDEPLGQYRQTTSGLSAIRSAHRMDVLEGHLAAYALAQMSGVDPDAVGRGRLSFRYVNAMASLRARRFNEFRYLANLTRADGFYATLRQRMVLRLPPGVAYAASKVFDGLPRSNRRKVAPQAADVKSRQSTASTL